MEINIVGNARKVALGDVELTSTLYIMTLIRVLMITLIKTDTDLNFFFLFSSYEYLLLVSSR